MRDSIVAIVVALALGGFSLGVGLSGAAREDRQTQACAPVAKVGGDGDRVICSDIDGGLRVLTVK